MRGDVAVVGGGPAGLALAIGAALRGLDVVLLERRAWPLDKACGEGLMPSGVRALERLGARRLIAPSECTAIAGVRYVQEEGPVAEACFDPAEGLGLGVRRVALAEALRRRAEAVGVRVLERAAVRGFARVEGGVRLDVAGARGDALHDGRLEARMVDEVRTIEARTVEARTVVARTVEARMVVAADGLASPLRRAEGLDAGTRGPRRFGLRQHFRLAGFGQLVEVHFAEGVEAYLTPAGSGRVGVAFLWEDGRVAQPVSFPSLLARFPRLARRLEGARADSAARGAGPFLRRARARTADRFALLGDAGGYVDAITGEGLSLALHCAETLADLLPAALAAGATREALRPYEREFARAFRRYAFFARALLAIARRPPLRRAVVRHLALHPRRFADLLGWVTAAAPSRAVSGGGGLDAADA